MSKTDGLWQRYKQRNDAQAREQLILEYAHMTKFVVDRMPIRTSAVVSYDDLLGHAIVGLIDAVEKFDPSRDIKFETYANTRIRGAILDALKSLDWIPRSVRATERKLRGVIANLEAEHGRPASDEEIAGAMGVTIDEMNNIMSDVGQTAVLSLEELLLYGEETADDDPTASDSGNPVIAIEAEERKKVLGKAVGELPEKEKLVVSLYYNDSLTLKEIAKVLGVTESRACQLHSKAVVRLHGKLARHQELLLAA
ncbi:MAG: FliA/WhiG family RNA polymerase sigma factor [Armatimonadota bacterium]|nr:FliA/WhiG family RNA polymerase sigma factor [Armatimonadota bacterium]